MDWMLTPYIREWAEGRGLSYDLPDGSTIEDFWVELFKYITSIEGRVESLEQSKTDDIGRPI